MLPRVLWLQRGLTSRQSALIPSASYVVNANDSVHYPSTSLSRPKSSDPAYATHIPLSSFQKGLLAILSSVGAFADPRRADLVATVSETTGIWALRAMRDRMQRTLEGRELLAERPRITDESVAHLWKLPRDTFGGAYASFMEERRFSPDERPPVRFVDDPELAWVATRAREVHDFWHVLFRCHTNVLGEVALKAVEFVQTGLPMTAMAVVAGEWRLRAADRTLLNREYLPWAMKAGAQAADLVTLYYERYFDVELESLRRQWRIEVAPQRELAPQNDRNTASKS